MQRGGLAAKAPGRPAHLYNTALAAAAQMLRKLNRIWRPAVRPHLLGVDHSILNLDLLWQFK
ncbi:MAG: hypothetical protein ACE5LU_14545 [Anaerolineae bacterium]